ncbi:MAG: hypothetical protein GX591_19295, partial [Planctomycetes bacterium]|nr:hypothetical protein [Planctomycetota bacterium]
MLVGLRGLSARLGRTPDTPAVPGPSGVEPLEPHVLLSGAAFYADEALLTPGLVGSYVDQALSDVADAADWRLTQTIAGWRLDDPVDFPANGWGSRAEVGLTGGSDEDWEEFSVQWDGYLEVAEPNLRLATVSDDGSRLWIDLDRDGDFEDDELADNHWGGWQGATQGDRTDGLAPGVYPCRIQYYEGGGDNNFRLAVTPYTPAAFVETPTNPRQVVKVIVLNFDPRVPGEGNRLLHEVFDWSDPHELAAQFEADLEWATGGAIDLQVVEFRDLDAFPTFTDGFRYTPDEYVALRRANGPWHDTGTDFYELVESQGLVDLVNSGQVDEIWTFGDHYFNLLGEAWMGGPGSFFINGPSFPDAGFDRAIAGYGFNYERSVAEMLHNLSHRTENHGQRAFGSWDLNNPTSAFDLYSANYLETAWGPYGVGTCHVPANADDHYDYGDERVVDSYAFDFANYPDMTWETRPVSRDTWAMGPVTDDHRDYMNWYFGMMPRNDGADADGRAANWFKYIWDFNSYEPDTGLGRQEDAVGAGPIVRAPGAASYDLTVRYYDDSGVDTSTLDLNDVRIIAPGGAVLTPVSLAIGDEAATTAGTARTVTYTLQPPGGWWDPADNGWYRIELADGEVEDLEANAFDSGEVGSFLVSLYDPAAVNVAALLACGQASVTHTPFDIGSVNNLFDGNTASLARTPSINPMVVTLELETPVEVTGFRTWFSHAGGEPAHAFTVELADSLSDLENRTGSYATISWDGPGEAYASAMLDEARQASVFRLTATRLHGDDYVHGCEWQLIGTGIAEGDAPTAALTAVDEAAGGMTAHFLEVTFTDQTAVEVPSIAGGDLVITGPGGLEITPTFYAVDDATDGPVRAATFWFIPPGGAWGWEDNGVYTLRLEAEAVRDVMYNAAVTEQVLGAFTVSIDPPQLHPPSDLAEGNAADWVAWADGADASVDDDAVRTIAGASSVRFQTNGGFDTSLAYPAPGMADWDLTWATELRFSVYAENPSPYDFQEGPRVRLNGVDGGYIEYIYYQDGYPATPLNGAIGQWVEFILPLDGTTEPTGWHVTAVGAASLEHIG